MIPNAPNEQPTCGNVIGGIATSRFLRISSSYLCNLSSFSNCAVVISRDTDTAWIIVYCKCVCVCVCVCRCACVVWCVCVCPSVRVCVQSFRVNKIPPKIINGFWWVLGRWGVAQGPIHYRFWWRCNNPFPNFSPP